MRTFHEGTTEPSLWRGANATWPLAELVIDYDERQVRLHVWRWLRSFNTLAYPSWPVLDWEAPLDSAAAEPFGRWFMTRGVLLRAPGRPPAIFWCLTRRKQRSVLSGFAPGSG